MCFQRLTDYLLLLGDVNLQTRGTMFTVIHNLRSFNLNRLQLAPTHKGIAFTRNFTRSNSLQVSDHFFVSFSLPVVLNNMPFVPSSTATIAFKIPLPLSSHHHCLHTCLHLYIHLFSDQPDKTVASTICTALFGLCPLTSKPTRLKPYSSWLSDILWTEKIAVLKENGRNPTLQK